MKNRLSPLYIRFRLCLLLRRKPERRIRIVRRRGNMSAEVRLDRSSKSQRGKKRFEANCKKLGSITKKEHGFAYLSETCANV